MKRRGFLSLLGMAPAVPLIAKELAKSVPMPEPPPPVTIPTKTVHYVPAEMMVAGTMGYMVSATYVAMPKHRR